MVGRTNAFRVTALGASLIALCALAVPVLMACGGDAGAGGTVPKTVVPTSSGGGGSVANDPGPAPTLKMPVSRFAASLDDLGNAFITNVPDTYVLTLDSLAKTASFKSEADGRKLLTDWGYLGGYETSYRPEGGDTAVLQGAFNAYVECDLFSTPANAEKAYNYYIQKFTDAKATATTLDTIGNQSAAFQFPGGSIRASSVNAVDHRLIFRRGNLVVVVRTLGADGFMTIQQARNIAQIIDAKALGTKPAIEPTPTSNFTPGAGNPKSTASATP